MDNVGGVNKIWLCDIANFNTVNPISEHEHEISVKDPDKIEVFSFMMDSSIYKESYKQDANGQVWRLTISGKVAKASASVVSVIQPSRKFVLISLDNNGLYRLHGDIDDYFIYDDVKIDPGKEYKTLNQVELTFKKECLYPSIYIKNPFS